jgi:hypothetical protein
MHWLVQGLADAAAGLPNVYGSSVTLLAVSFAVSALGIGDYLQGGMKVIYGSDPARLP